MTKCRIINRLDFTRNTSAFLRNRDYPHPEPLPQNPHGDICPRCGLHTLRHVEGCERCSACGYDACSWGDLDIRKEV